MSRWQDAPWDQRPFREDEMREWERSMAGAAESLGFAFAALWRAVMLKTLLRVSPRALWWLLVLDLTALLALVAYGTVTS